MNAPTVQDANVVVAVWLPAGNDESPSLVEHGLQHPSDVPGWKSLSDGSRLGLVTPAETWHDGRNGRDGREVSEAEQLLECRKRVDGFLQSCGWKEERFLQKWPLHHSIKGTLLLHALGPKWRQLRYTESCFWWQTAGRLPFLDRIHHAFGEAIAWSFGWQVTFSVCLFVLAVSCIACTAVKWSAARQCIMVTENQSLVMKRLQDHWYQLVPPTPRSDETSELSSEVSFNQSRRMSSGRRWQSETGQNCLSFLRRNFRFQLCCAPILLMEWLFIWACFLAFFWLQLWTTFEWGGCREYNERTQSRDCMSPEFLYPVWGKVLAAVPSFAQGFVFEFVSGLSKLSMAFIVKMQNWESQDEMRCAAATYYFFLEVVGKLGFICVLGFLYVPDYGGDELGCSRRLDFWFLGNWSFSCLKLNVPRSLRLQLFLASVRGPFLTSGFFGIFKKTLLPILLEYLRSLEASTQPLKCIVRCSIAFLRLLMAILYCDLYPRDAGAAASLGAVPRLADAAAEADAAEVQRALREGQRRPFDPLKESVELLMHFLWVSCFVAVYPLGGILAFANQALELRFDALKLLAARRRPWPRPASAEKEWVPSCAKWIVHIAIVMNVLVLLLPFALAASDCGGALIVENPCTLKTALTAVLGILGLEVYWSLLSKLLRCTWCGRCTRPVTLDGVPPAVHGAGDFSPEILPSASTKRLKTTPWRLASDCCGCRWL